MGLLGGSWKLDAIAMIVLLLTLVYLFFKRKYSYWERKGIKTLPGLNYLFGHYGSVYTHRESLPELFVRLYRASSDPFSGFYGFLRHILLLRDPMLIHTILIKDFSYFTDRADEINEDYDPLTGNIVNLPGEKWRQVRGKFTPTFTSGKLKAMFSTLLNCGSSLEKYLEKLAEKSEVVDVIDVTARHGTNFIASVFFGIDVDTVNNPDNDFRKYGSRIFKTSSWNAFKRLSRLVAPQIIRLLRIKFADAGVEQFFNLIVKQNLEYREKNNVSRKDFFQLLVQLRNTGKVQLDNEWETVIKTNSNEKTMSEAEVAAHSFAFFGAGFETSASTLSFCLYELAKNPDVQERLRNEINEVLQKHNGQITYESVMEMKFLGYCIDGKLQKKFLFPSISQNFSFFTETLRMYPIFPNITRKCVKDYQIPGTDKVIEKGDIVIAPGFAIHRDERYYPEPERFNPDRFNEQNSAGKNQVNRPYLPFGDGPRNCIGLRLGKMQAQVGTIIMLKNFKYELDDYLKNHDMEFEVRATMVVPRHGIKLKIFKIKTNSNF